MFPLKGTLTKNAMLPGKPFRIHIFPKSLPVFATIKTIFFHKMTYVYNKSFRKQNAMIYFIFFVPLPGRTFHQQGVINFTQRKILIFVHRCSVVCIDIYYRKLGQ